MNELPPMDFKRMGVRAVCRLFRQQLGADGLARLAELEAGIRPPRRRDRPDKARLARSLARKLARAVRDLDWSGGLPAAEWLRWYCDMGEKDETARAVLHAVLPTAALPARRAKRRIPDAPGQLVID